MHLVHLTSSRRKLLTLLLIATRDFRSPILLEKMAWPYPWVELLYLGLKYQRILNWAIISGQRIQSTSIQIPITHEFQEIPRSVCKLFDKLRCILPWNCRPLGQLIRTILPMPNTDIATKMATIQIEDSQVPLVEIRSTGDILLDVQFKNTSECTKSIPKDALRSLRTRKLPITSPRILYRVRLDTLKKHSDYFRTMLKPQFAEGLAVEKVLKELADTNQVAAELEPEKLPRISIIDEDTATKTFGREVVFRDMLRIIHGAVSTYAVSLLAAIAKPLYRILSHLRSRHNASLSSSSWQISTTSCLQSPVICKKSS